MLHQMQQIFERIASYTTKGLQDLESGPVISTGAPALRLCMCKDLKSREIQQPSCVLGYRDGGGYDATLAKTREIVGGCSELPSWAYRQAREGGGGQGPT